MSKDYIIFDQNADSVTVGSFCGAGKDLLELGFSALEDAKLSRALSLPLLEEFCWQESSDGGGENSEGIDGLLNLAEDVESTEIELRVMQLFKILRDMVGSRENIDAVDVFEQTIRYIKNLQTELRCNFY